MVYVFGGHYKYSSAEEYSLTREKWSLMPSLPQNGVYAGSACIHENEIYMVGFDSNYTIKFIPETQMSFRQNLLIKLSGMKLIFSTGLALAILSDKGIEYTWEPDSKTCTLVEIPCLRGTLAKMCSNRL